MLKKNYIYIVIIIVLILISIFGFIYYQKTISKNNAKILSLNNELKIIQKKQKNTHLIYTMMKKSYFKPALSNSSLIALAVLLDDKKICDDISDNDKKLCYNVFDNKCSEYEYPNREICAKLNIMLDRKITPNEIIHHCNDKNLINNDLSQVHCFQNFAKLTKNSNLCDEICKTPINNTNCRAYCGDNKNNLILCKKLYIKQCFDYASK